MTLFTFSFNAGSGFTQDPLADLVVRVAAGSSSGAAESM